MLALLIKSNLRHERSHMLSFFLIMLLSAVMLFTGLMVMTGYRQLFEKKRIELSSADLVVEQQTDSAEKLAELEAILRASAYVEDFEKYETVQRECVYTSAGYDADIADSYTMANLILNFLPYETWDQIEPPNMFELAGEEFDDPIYVSLSENAKLMRAQLGDEVILKVDGKFQSFHLAGLYEDISLGNTALVAYVSPRQYRDWLEEDLQMPTPMRNALYLVRFSAGTAPTQAAADLAESLSRRQVAATVSDIESTITASTFSQNTIAAIMSAFALAITAISLVIIYFRISNSIEQNVVNIGTQKALGCTSGQIRLAMTLEFGAVAAAAVLCGVVLSFPILGVIESETRASTNLIWEVSLLPGPFLLTLGILLGTVLLVAFISTRKIQPLDPFVALQFGLDPEERSVNRLPLARTHGPLTWALARKDAVSGTRQNVMLSVVMVSVGLVTVFSLFLAKNVVMDPIRFYRLMNSTAPDVEFIVKDESARYELESFPEVESVWWIDSLYMTVNNHKALVTYTDDWYAIPGVNVYEGVPPRYDDEASIGGTLARTLGVRLGDEVTVRNGAESWSYRITGYQQSADNNGEELSLTEEGAAHLGCKRDATRLSVQVRGHDLALSQKVAEDAEAVLGERLDSYNNYIELLAQGGNELVSAVGAIVVMLLIVSALVILLSMNLLVKTVIIRKSREIGIKKAVGFSNRQLRGELTLSIMPQIVLGAGAGAVLGYFTSNTLMAFLLRTMGIMRSNMEVQPWMCLAAVLLASAVSFFIIWLLSGRIGKISAYSLITE